MNEREDNIQPAARKVHIALVGGQAAPVYNGIVATSPDVVEFVYSWKTKQVQERVVNEIDCEVADSEPLKEYDMLSIIDRARKLYDKYKNDKVTLNISGGTKPWSHLFAQEFGLHPRCTTIYIDQNNKLWDFTHLTQSQPKLKFDMQREFRLQGTPLASYRLFSEYTKEDEEAAAKIEGLRRESKYAVFNGLFAVVERKAGGLYDQIKTKDEGEYTDSATSSTVKWCTTVIGEKQAKKVEICLIDKQSQPHTSVIESPHSIELLFNSGWFEYKVARTLNKQFSKEKIYMNCVFKAVSRKDKNEVDIIVDMGYKMLFVECKTQIFNPIDIDKFRAVHKNYGGLACKALFVTEAKKTEEAIEKCREHGIMECWLANEQSGQYMIDMIMRELMKQNPV